MSTTRSLQREQTFRLQHFIFLHTRRTRFRLAISELVYACAGFPLPYLLFTRPSRVDVSTGLDGRSV